MDELQVTISKRRLEELESLERRLPLLLEEACAAYKANRLKELRERDKADVTLGRARARRYADKHRDIINAKRRQKRNPSSNNSVIDSSPPVEPAEEHGDAGGPGPEHGNPEHGDITPSDVSPVVLGGSGDKEAEAPQPKHKGRPKKVRDRHSLHLV